jgi:hypothetical protein
MILRDVDERRPPTATAALIVAGEVALSDHADLTSMPVESMTSNGATWRPGLWRGQR